MVHFRGCGFCRCSFSHLFLFTFSRTFTCDSATGCLNTADTKCALGCNISSSLKISFSAYKSVIDPSTAAAPTGQDPHYPHREVSFGSEPLGEVVEGVQLGADRIAVAMDLVEQVCRLVQTVITDVYVLLLYILRPSCRKEQTLH